ncbi:hypothetical protein HK099_007747 [Clydaea vesicula]|uniref:C2H2-type domain-containing protein n=1 Tax=Clydaea vesicula TaxID=447962 RepID=A0AAD5TWV9_9FUNG|nr:hypothetical protein HK099_007747 [Clydaea vesicula]
MTDVKCLWHNCSKCFQTELDCFNHLQQFHSKPGKVLCHWNSSFPYRLKLCNTILNHKLSFQSHIITHFSKDLKPFKCLNCLFVHRSRQELRKHEAIVHNIQHNAGRKKSKQFSNQETSETDIVTAKSSSENSLVCYFKHGENFVNVSTINNENAESVNVNVFQYFRSPLICGPSIAPCNYGTNIFPLIEAFKFINTNFKLNLSLNQEWNSKFSFIMKNGGYMLPIMLTEFHNFIVSSSKLDVDKFIEVMTLCFEMKLSQVANILYLSLFVTIKNFKDAVINKVKQNQKKVTPLTPAYNNTYKDLLFLILNHLIFHMKIIVNSDDVKIVELKNNSKFFQVKNNCSKSQLGLLLTINTYGNEIALELRKRSNSKFFINKNNYKTSNFVLRETLQQLFDNLVWGEEGDIIRNQCCLGLICKPKSLRERSFVSVNSININSDQILIWFKIGIDLSWVNSPPPTPDEPFVLV